MTLRLPPLSVCFIFVLEFGLDLLFHPQRPPGISVWLPVHWDELLLRKQDLSINQDPRILFPFPRSFTHETLPHGFLKRPKSAFPKSRAVTFLFTTVPALRILNFTILWSQHPRLSLTFIFTTRSMFLVGWDPHRGISFLAHLSLQGGIYQKRSPGKSWIACKVSVSNSSFLMQNTIHSNWSLGNRRFNFCSSFS